MKPTSLAIAAVLAGLCASGCSTSSSARRDATAPHESARTGGERAAVTKLIEETASANNAGAVDRWVALFARDFVYMANGSPPLMTRDEFAAVARTGFRNRASITIEPVEIAICSDGEFARNRVSGTVELHGSGKAIPIDVKQIVIHTRESGPWRIARMLSNSNTP